MIIEIRDDRHMRALTGLSQAQFAQLLKTFSQVYQAKRQADYEQARQAGRRQRQLGGGRKSKLPTVADKLLFVLYYYKNYPTFDVLGTQFQLARSKAHTQIYQLSPLLHETLVELAMMPARAFTSVAELTRALKGVDQIIIDATERTYRRPQDAARQRAHYSGKKTPYPQEYADFDRRKGDRLSGLYLRRSPA
jgi:Helix-turn-helix of DDE superfamily endonuclease